MAGVSGKPCYYAVLGVARDASAADIRAAHLKLALRLHPDKLQLPGEDAGAIEEAQARFHRLQEAYEVLSDASRRATYDANLLRQPSVPDLASTFQSMDDLIGQMERRMARMRGVVDRLKQGSNPNLDTLRAMLQEVTKGNNLHPTPARAGPPQRQNGSPSSSPTSSSCSDARTGGAGPEAAARSAGGKQSAGSSSSTPSPRGTKRPPSPGSYDSHSRKLKASCLSSCIVRATKCAKLKNDEPNKRSLLYIVEKDGYL